MSKINQTDFPGLFLIEPKVFTDSRGFFYESFRSDDFNEQNNPINFVQDNISKSCKNTLRGLHFQTGEKAQGKLCQVLAGAVLDVALDLRNGSPTFGKYFSVILSESNHTQIYIPPGFAHGFSVLSEEVLFHYKCTGYYSKEHEGTVLYNDTALGIDWQNDAPIVSPKDLQGSLFSQSTNIFYY